MISLLRFWFSLALLAAASAAGAQGADGVSVQEARAMLAQGAVLIDVREPKEHLSGVAPGAQLLPMSQFDTRWREVPTDPATPVLLVCRTQNRSQALLNRLRAKGGYAHVRFVQGGMNEWAKEGGPLVMPAGAAPPASAPAPAAP